MPIQIIDNFEVTVQKPIDNRFVVGGTSSFYPNRYSIVNPYRGLRIWDLNDNQPYVYNGSTWSSEASGTTLQGNGSAGYIARYNTSNSLQNSVIFENSGNIIIGTTSVGTPPAKLVVDGHIRANSGYYYYGSGLFLTSLNASEITSGTLNLARLQLTGSSNWILSRNSSTAIWTNPNQLTVGTASALATTRTLWGQNFNGTANVTGNINVNGNVVNVGILQFRNNALPTPGTLNVNWLGTGNLPCNLNIPGYNFTRTMALLEQPQTFTKVNTFTDHTNLDTVQVSGTSSFFDKMNVTVSETLPFPPPIGPVTFTTKSLRVVLGAVGIGEDIGNPYIVGFGNTNAYTFKDDADSGMFRVAPTNSTQSSIRMLSDSRIQMVFGNNVSSSYSTSVEQYTTPGIAMMSILDVFTIADFNNATHGPGAPKVVWLTNSPWAGSIIANNLPWTVDIAGTSGSGAGAAAAGIDAVNYDRLISVQTGGSVNAILYLQAPNGTYYQTQLIWRDSHYTMIVPAGRKWKLSALRNPGGQSVVVSGNTYFIAGDQSVFDDIRVFIYKYGMS